MDMMALYRQQGINLGPLTLKEGKFTPTTGVRQIRVGEHCGSNPGVEDYKADWRNRKSAGFAVQTRFICGLNIGKKAMLEPKDFWFVISKLRRDYGYSPDSTLIVGEGMWTSSEFGVVNERSAQLSVLDFGIDPAGLEVFGEQQIEIASIAAKQLFQETVVLEISQGGGVLFSSLIGSGLSISKDSQGNPVADGTAFHQIQRAVLELHGAASDFFKTCS